METNKLDDEKKEKIRNILRASEETIKKSEETIKEADDVIREIKLCKNRKLEKISKLL